MSKSGNGNGNLVISRSLDEKILINNGEIIIHVIEIRPGKVRLAISAPKTIPVHREEVQEAIARGVSKSLRVQPKRDSARLNSFAVPIESAGIPEEQLPVS